MKPHRLCMTHHLVLSYELHNKMEIYVKTLVSFYVKFSIFWMKSKGIEFICCYIVRCRGLTRLILWSWRNSILRIMLTSCIGSTLTRSTCTLMNWLNVFMFTLSSSFFNLYIVNCLILMTETLLCCFFVPLFEYLMPFLTSS